MTERYLRRRGVFALGALLTVSLTGCLATRQDVQILQEDLRMIRSEAARDDSIRAAQIDRLNRALNDSISALSRRVAQSRTDAEGRFTTIEEQLMQTQELAGQSQRRVQEMRAALETARVATSDTAAGAAVAAEPGPNQLFQLGRDQFMRGSNTAARAAFQELLNRYPDADVADEAQFHVAETYSAEGNAAAADSVYGIVISRFARSPRTATALYKRGVIAQNADRNADARRFFNEVVNRFPRTDEAMLARDRLRSLR